MLDRETLMFIGNVLRNASRDIVKAPFPAEWLTLLAALDAKPSGPVTT